MNAATPLADAPLFPTEADDAPADARELAIAAAVRAFRSSNAEGMHARMAAALDAAAPYLVDDDAVARGVETLAALQETAREGTTVTLQWGAAAVLDAGMRSRVA